jgi:hypothetical protein
MLASASRGFVRLDARPIRRQDAAWRSARQEVWQPERPFWFATLHVGQFLRILNGASFHYFGHLYG